MKFKKIEDRGLGLVAVFETVFAGDDVALDKKNLELRIKNLTDKGISTKQERLVLAELNRLTT